MTAAWIIVPFILGRAKRDLIDFTFEIPGTIRVVTNECDGEWMIVILVDEQIGENCSR